MRNTKDSLIEYDISLSESLYYNVYRNGKTFWREDNKNYDFLIIFALIYGGHRPKNMVYSRDRDDKTA